ncbi:MAG: orotate phosphoribosyltransferase [Magnetococcus sp. DMHC-6]
MFNNTSRAFLRFAMESGVLRFGQFQTKAGRQSPYFFNAGGFDNGHVMARLGAYYAETIQQSDLPMDMIFGPAYKGIPLAVATTIALSNQYNLKIPFAFNRKESKDHGEGGNLIGAPLQGRVLIIDDVISAGTSVGESVAWIQKAGATPSGVLIALDRQEQGLHSTAGAIQEVRERFGLPVIAIACLADLILLLENDPDHIKHLPAILAYKNRYGIEQKYDALRAKD